MMKKIKKHGGARPGAGRNKSGIEKKTISFKVPVEIVDQLKEKIKKLIVAETQQKAPSEATPGEEI